MAVALNPRAERLLARLPRVTVYSALELLLLVLIAVQCARLFWAVLTPLGPVGDWKALDLIRPAAASAPTLGAFEPFFRSAPGAAAPSTVVVTTLDVRLYGVLANQATGGGSAIIGTPDGRQQSYQMGEEIMPGVMLTGVSFDHVTVTRNGTAEQLYLDQTPTGNAPPPPPPGAAPQPVPVITAPPAPIQVPTVQAPPRQPPTTNQAVPPRGNQ